MTTMAEMKREITSLQKRVTALEELVDHVLAGNKMRALEMDGIHKRLVALETVPRWEYHQHTHNDWPILIPQISPEPWRPYTITYEGCAT